MDEFLTNSVQDDAQVHQISSFMNMDATQTQNQNGSDQYFEKNDNFEQIVVDEGFGNENKPQLETQPPESDKKDSEMRTNQIWLEKPGSENSQSGVEEKVASQQEPNASGDKEPSLHQSETTTTDSSSKVDDENNLDFVEGFQIFSDDTPVDVSKLPIGDEAMEVESPQYLDTNPEVKTKNVKQKSKSVIKMPRLHYPQFKKGVIGPNYIKEAIYALGGKATGMEIVDWIATYKLSEFQNMFDNDRKKLRYSIIGILSAKSYGSMFKRADNSDHGIKGAYWMVGDADAVPIDEMEAAAQLLEYGPPSDGIEKVVKMASEFEAVLIILPIFALSNRWGLSLTVVFLVKDGRPSLSIQLVLIEFNRNLLQKPVVYATWELMTISSFFVMVVIWVATCTASNLLWNPYLKVLGSVIDVLN